jgi:enoyl-CoA hydratase/carnithine racemase
MDEPLHVDVRGLVDLVRPGSLDDRLSALSGLPLVVVDLDGEAARVIPDLLEGLTLSALPCIVVGQALQPLSAAAARVAAQLDLVIAGADAPANNDAGGLGAIVETVRRSPLAAVSLALLLRQRFYERPVGGLVAESATYSALQAGPEFTRWLAARSTESREDDGDRLLVRRESDALHVTLARPARRNAVDATMRDALHEALVMALSDSDVRVVLSGLGPAFCSGGDLTEFGTATDPAQAHIVRVTHSLARLLLLLGGRTEARVHGACIGAGIELAAFASRVVGAPDAFFGLPEVRMGLIPGAGGTVSLPRRVGRQRTLHLALCGRHIDAPTALRWGLLEAIAADRPAHPGGAV